MPRRQSRHHECSDTNPTISVMECETLQGVAVFYLLMTSGVNSAMVTRRGYVIKTRNLKIYITKTQHLKKITKHLMTIDQQKHGRQNAHHKLTNCLPTIL